MNYQQLLDYTHSLLKFGIKPGLERISKLLDLLGNPQDELNCIHIAGTNGKGSVCAMLSSIAKEWGKKTGIFISPYIVDFRERIQINGEYISEDEYSQIATRVKSAIDGGGFEESPTEFEFITAVAFLYFKEKQCDICIIETGMGGRLDSTNVIKKPLCSVITRISMDHTAVLGDTLAKISGEKSGIIKKGCSVITTPLQSNEALSVIMERVALQSTTLYMPAVENVKIISSDLKGNEFSADGQIFRIPLCGAFQIENACLAIETAKVLQIPVETVKKGLEKVLHPARLQVLSEKPLIILDGAHNVGGFEALKKSLETFFKGQKLFGVCGMLEDKDYMGSVKTVLPMFDEVIAVTPDNPRALSAKKMCDLIEKNGVKCSVADVDESLKEIIARKAGNRPTVIFGSLYLASQIIKIYRQ